MTRYKYRLLALAVLVCGSLGAAADATLDQAQQLLSSKQPAAAYELLAPLEDERAGTPDYDYLLGLAALDSGRPGEAVFALERVLAVAPDHTLARAEIARAYYELSEFETARREFENVRASREVPDSARVLMDQYLAVIDRAQQGGARRFSGYLTLAGGYDSNVNSGTDENRIAIPLFNNLVFDLNDKARETESPYALVAAGVDLVHPLNEMWSAIGGARGYLRTVENPFSTQDAYLYGGLRADHGKHQFTLAGQGEDFAVDYDTLRYVYGGYGQWSYTIDNRSRFNLAVQISQIDYPDLSNRDATRYIASTGYLLAIGGKREPLVYAGVYGGVEEENDGDFEQFGHDVYGARAGGSLELYARMRGYASLSFEQRDYHGDDPIFLRTRDDTQLMVSGGVEYTPQRNWQVRPNVTYTNNDSNIVINDFDRIVAGVDVTMQF